MFASGCYIEVGKSMTSGSKTVLCLYWY